LLTWWGSRPLLHKLLLGFGLVLLLAGGATAVTIYGILQIQSQQAYTDDQLRPPLAAAQDASSVLHRYESDVAQAIIDRTPAGKDDITNSHADLQKLTAAVQRLRTLAIDETTRSAIGSTGQIPGQKASKRSKRTVCASAPVTSSTQQMQHWLLLT
jgi:CHASE3 domain sensor protein